MKLTQSQANKGFCLFVTNITKKEVQQLPCID